MKASLQPSKSFSSAASPTSAQRKGGLKTIVNNRPSDAAQRRLQQVLQQHKKKGSLSSVIQRMNNGVSPLTAVLPPGDSHFLSNISQGSLEQLKKQEIKFSFCEKSTMVADTNSIRNYITAGDIHFNKAVSSDGLVSWAERADHFEYTLKEINGHDTYCRVYVTHSKTDHQLFPIRGEGKASRDKKVFFGTTLKEMVETFCELDMTIDDNKKVSFCFAVDKAAVANELKAIDNNTQLDAKQKMAAKSEIEPKKSSNNYKLSCIARVNNIIKEYEATKKK